jgi:preprotein translocase subunit SecA
VRVGDVSERLDTVTDMPGHPIPTGIPNRHVRRLLGTYEAVDAAAGLVATADDAQLYEIYAEQRRLLETECGGAQLGLVLACAAEMSRRALRLEPRQGQLLVAIALSEGLFAEFPTGEGKTLAVGMASLWLAPKYQGVHIVTANEYLSRRDAAVMAPLYEAAGLTVSAVGDQQQDRSERYQADVVYGTLRRIASDIQTDELLTRADLQLRPRTGALVVDEADAVLIDAATQPFSVVGTGARLSGLQRYWDMAAGLDQRRDYGVDHVKQTVWLLPEGVRRVEEGLGTGLYERPQQVQWLHAALMVKTFYKEGQQYLVENGRPVLLDTVSGRIRPNAKLSHGLHPMLEASCGVTAGPLSVTFSRISTRSLTKRYRHLCGTGGTLTTDRDELRAVYGRDTVVVPASHQNGLHRHPDRVYVTRTAKLTALCTQVVDLHRSGRPVLVGTVSVEDAEEVSRRLDGLGIAHELVTARDHDHEAEVLARAGRRHAVTVTARLAGRGVDIVVEPGVGDLFVIAAERFDSRREDRQLFGRTARNGSSGECVAYVSCEDDLLRVHGGTALESALRTLPPGETDGIQVPGIGMLLDRAQRQLEAMRATQRAAVLVTDDAIEAESARFRAWRVDLLTRRDLHTVMTGIYERRLSVLPWRARRSPNHVHLQGVWPKDTALPDNSDGWARSLGDTVVAGLRHRISSALGAESEALGTDVVVQAVLEVADSEWTVFLAESEAITDSEGGTSQAITEIGRSASRFWERLDTRVARVVWGSTFSPRGEDVQPGVEQSPSGS